jgi:hypothetical protein
MTTGKSKDKVKRSNEERYTKRSIYGMIRKNEDSFVTRQLILGKM